MNVAWLASLEGQEVISQARLATDPLTAITALRKKFSSVDPALISQALTQAQLQLRLGTRWNIDANDLILTDDGIMQASRPAVAKFRAEWIAKTFGANAHVLDLTCGLGFDVLAMANAGLKVTALELDLETALAAQHNLRNTTVEVINADCLNFEVPKSVDVIFVDPARRNPDAPRKADGSSHRLFNPEDWSPSWDFVIQLAANYPVAAKVAPGFDTSLVESWDATWISVDGDLVETFLTSTGSGERSATLIDTQFGAVTKYSGNQVTKVSSIGNFLIVPDTALIRASALTNLADAASGGLVNEHIAWLTSHDESAVRQLINNSPRPAMGFQIVETIKYSDKLLSSAVKNHEASGITIMTRGMQIDVEALRKQLAKAAPKGAAELVIAIYRDDAGPQALICRRLT